MTRLTKPVTRYLDVYLRIGARREHDLPLVVKLAVEGIYLKRVRQRWSRAYLVPWGAAYQLGGTLEGTRRRRERQQRRKARQEGRA